VYKIPLENQVQNVSR